MTNFAKCALWKYEIQVEITENLREHIATLQEHLKENIREQKDIKENDWTFKNMHINVDKDSNRAPTHYTYTQEYVIT